MMRVVKTKTQQAQFAWVPVTTQVRGQDWITLQRTAGKMTMAGVTKFFRSSFPILEYQSIQTPV